MLMRLPRSPPFPYTTLFRSWIEGRKTIRWVASTLPDHPPAVNHAASLEEDLQPKLDSPRDIALAAGMSKVEVRVIRPPELVRSEEHTSELQSLTNLVCRLLL